MLGRTKKLLDKEEANENRTVQKLPSLHCNIKQTGTVPSWSCSKAVYKPPRHIPLLKVQWINSWWWTDELSETCRVSCQNKFVKLVHLVGFIIKEICYDARSNEHKKSINMLTRVWSCNFIFNIPTKCTYTVKQMYYCQHSPTCFGT
jgi:hypothetical protein